MSYVGQMFDLINFDAYVCNLCNLSEPKKDLPHFPTTTFLLVSSQSDAEEPVIRSFGSC